MAGFEVVVRPVVFPDIRPRARQSLPPQDDPEKGFAVIKGNPAKVVGFTNTWSMSSSKSKPTETSRRVDDVRVYKKDDDGTVDKNTYVDLQVANRITMNHGSGDQSGFVGFDGDDPGRGVTGDDIKVSYYRPVQEADNIEVKRHNHILPSGDEVEAGGPI